jgi:MFS family permease
MRIENAAPAAAPGPAGKPRSVAQRSLGLLGRDRAFRRFWAAHTVSAGGDAVTLVALPTVAILSLHADGLVVGGLTAVSGLAWGIFGLPAGVWADRLPRRAVMVVCDLVRLALIASVPVAYLLGTVTIWQLVVVAALAASATVFFSTASTSSIPEILGPPDFAEANSRLELSTSASMLTGPPLAGALISLAGAPLALVADALSFLASALLLRGMPPGTSPPHRGARLSFGRELAIGLRAVRHQPLLIRAAVCAALSNVGGAACQAVLLLFVYRGLGLAPAVAGVALGLGAAGTMAGAVAVPRLARRFAAGALLLTETTAGALALLLIEPALLGLPVLWVVVALAVRGFLGPLWNVTIVTIRQVLVPQDLQGRVTAALRMVGFAAVSVGALAGGALGQVLAARFGPADGYGLTIAVFSLIGSASGLVLLPKAIRKFRL